MDPHSPAPPPEIRWLAARARPHPPRKTRTESQRPPAPRKFCAIATTVPTPAADHPQRSLPLACRPALEAAPPPTEPRPHRAHLQPTPHPAPPPSSSTPSPPRSSFLGVFSVSMQGLKRKAALPESPTFEIRARPLDCEKRLPLVFTSEEERRVDPGLPGEDSLGAAPLDTPPRAMAASPSPLAAYFVGCGASSSSGLYRTYSRDSFSHAGADDEITVPLFTALADWEAFPRQFTRPPELIKGRPPVEEDLVEYEMDLDDEKWLADWNQHNPGTLIEVDDFELYLDRLEKARARPAPRGPR